MTNETSVPPDRRECCPGCGSRSVKPVPGIGKALDAPTRSAVFRQNEYRILRCADCGLVFKDSILTEEQFSRYYGDFEFSTWEASETYPTERPVLRFLQTLPPGSKVLDFGCSTGRLLAQAPRGLELHGFEINQEAAAKGAARGIRMVGKWDDLAAHAGSVDALVMMDVFEHIEKPTGLLEALLRLVKPGGSLVIATGNADSRACRVDLPNFWYFRNIQHVAMLTRKYCEFAARKFGLRIAQWHECSHYDVGLPHKAAQHLRHSIYSCLHQSPDSLAARLLRNLPGLRRCAEWKIPPPFTASKNHVVVIFEKVGTPNSAFRLSL